MKHKLDDIVENLLKEIKKGRSIEDCLKQYPDIAGELRPLLELALQIEGLPKPEPDIISVEATIKKVHAITVAKKKSKIMFSFKKLFSFNPVLVRSIAMILLIVIFGTTTVFLSARSLPGDLLYPVKLFTEKVQYVLTINPEGKAELHLIFADKRSEEFVLTFKEGEKINRELLNLMLNEAKLALGFVESMPKDQSKQLLEKIIRCNHHQKEVLEKIKPMVCAHDTSFIDQAINLCNERHQCLKCVMDESPINPDESLPCGRENCNIR